MLGRAHPLAAGVDTETRDPGDVNGQRPAADPISGLEHDDIPAGGDQAVRSRQAGDSGSDDDRIVTHHAETMRICRMTSTTGRIRSWS